MSFAFGGEGVGVDAGAMEDASDGDESCLFGSGGDVVGVVPTEVPVWAEEGEGTCVGVGNSGYVDFADDFGGEVGEGFGGVGGWVGGWVGCHDGGG